MRNPDHLQGYLCIRVFVYVMMMMFRDNLRTAQQRIGEISARPSRLNIETDCVESCLFGRDLLQLALSQLLVS